MKFVKFLLTLLLGIIIGIVLVVAGVGGGAYLLLTKDGSMKKIQDAVNSAVPEIGIEFDQEILDMSALNYGKEVLSKFKDIKNVTLADIETLIGLDVITDTLESVIGLPKDASKNSTVNTLPEAISSNLTVSVVGDKFSVEFPDLPLFKSDEFLNKPLSTAFQSLETQTLDKFITIVYDADATAENPASSKVVQKLGVKTLGDMSADIDGIINEMTIGELIEISADSPKLLQVLKDCSLETVYNEDETVKSLGISDQIKVLQLKDIVDTGNATVWSYLGEFTLDNIGQGVDDMKLQDAIAITETSHVIIKKLADKKINNIGEEMNGVISSTTVGELITIDPSDPDTEPILKALAGTVLTANALNEKMAALTIGDCIKNPDVGVMSLVPETTPLSNVADVLGAKVAETNLFVLSELGIYNVNVDTLSEEKKAFIYNLTSTKIIQNYIDIIKGDSTGSFLPTIIEFTGSVLNQEALNNLSGFEEGVTLKITNDCLIMAGTTFTSLFNITVDSGKTLSIDENVNIDNPGGYMYIGGQGTVSFLNSAQGIGSIRKLKKSAAQSVPAVKVDIVSGGTETN